MSDHDAVIRAELAKAEDELSVTLQERKGVDVRRAELTAKAKLLRAAISRYKVALGIPARSAQTTED
jgi:hypothetical protein